MLRRAPGSARAFRRRDHRLVQALRDEDLFKQPGVPETLDWANVLLALDQETLSYGILRDTLACSSSTRTTSTRSTTRRRGGCCGRAGRRRPARALTAFTGALASGARSACQTPLVG